MPQSQTFLLGGLVVVVLSALIPRWLARFRMARDIERGLKADDVVDMPLDLDRLPDYHRGVRTPDDPDTIDDATWRDLDLDAVFAAVDRTASQVGRQVLYHTLRQPHYAREPLAQRERATMRFADAPRDVAQVRTILRPLTDRRAAHVADLLYGNLPARPSYWWVFPLLTIAAMTCLALIAIWPKAALVWLGICCTNIVVQLWYRPRVKRLLVGFQSVPSFLRAAERLAQLESTGLEQDVATLRQDGPQLASLRRATSWLLFESGTANDIVAMLYEYVNLLFLIDINALVFSTQRVADARPLLRRVFEAVGRIDTAQSIARWRASLPAWSVPQFTAPGKSLRTEQLVHPLLQHPVGNALTVDRTSVLITGSNMAGKTTFMRTLGVNAVLAQTLRTVCAETWEAPFFRVRSSIGRADSLLDGKSHYMAEVESVQSLLRAKSADRQHLFLLDEMFRGTNTAERVAAAYAVLAYLTRGLDVVVVATHDVELLALLGDRFATYHFRERIENDTLSFDYQLRAGPSSTRNAIALLKLKRYPDEIIEAALAVLDG